MSMSDLETVQKLEAELFTPALQQAALQAKEQGYNKEDTLYGIANAYLNLLVPFLGDKKTAADFLQHQLDYLREHD